MIRLTPRKTGDDIYIASGSPACRLSALSAYCLPTGKNQSSSSPFQSTPPHGGADAYNKAQSDTANDLEYFTDAYLVISGAGGGLVNDETDGEDEPRSLMGSFRDNRLLELPEKGMAEWLVKTINDSATEHYKDRLRNDLFFLSQVPALTDEHFASNISGIALKYKLIGLEELSIEKENKFRSALRKKIKFILGFISLRLNRSYDPAAIDIVFSRNNIENLSEMADNARKLDGIISKETLLSTLAFIENPAAELERIKEEQSEEFSDPL